MAATPATLDWGANTQQDIQIISEEIFKNKVYERCYTVQRGDIVMDIGANVGAFTVSILDREPAKVLCLEPSSTLIPTLQANTQSEQVTVLGIGIGSYTAPVRYDPAVSNIFAAKPDDTVYLTKFSGLVEAHHLDHIDMLKVDCEGGEYDIFTTENLRWIKQNVRHVAAEFHLNVTADALEKFKKFRDLYLPHFPGALIIDFWGNDVTTLVQQDDWLTGYIAFHRNASQVLVYLTNDSTPIPVISTAILTGTYWLRELVRSIDYPVDNLLVVNNSGKEYLAQQLLELKECGSIYIRKMHILNMPDNIGLAASWNLTIKLFLNSPYWVFVNDDVQFNPGMLRQMQDATLADPVVGIIHGHAGDFGVGSYNLFLIRDHIIAEFGLFDENCYPAYCEDVDYIMRTIHRPIKKIMSLPAGYRHGSGGMDDYEATGRQSSRHDATLSARLWEVNGKNFSYMNQKWGTGWRMCSPTVTPQNDISLVGGFDLRFAREKYLTF